MLWRITGYHCFCGGSPGLKAAASQCCPGGFHTGLTAATAGNVVSLLLGRPQEVSVMLF
ncbi:hypothetical protein PC128_g16519 [Phytophthora cactorum]|nr:hypothetical protein PC120_g22774 [Phytophthora cactorum]KAG3178169.1 hypothetical protein PC128_g16519 [Phytophthora cactorum]KAG4041236.1 hypothetical protein PC123_g23246 [Phytophthora cactorum]